MKKEIGFLGGILLSTLITGTSNATLFDRGGGLIYDDVLDITWLQDANYAQTSGYDSYGYMTWYEATAWADGLEYYDSVRDITWDDWRLPMTVDGLSEWGYDGTTTAGYNIISSEMGHMYYVNLNNLGYYDTEGNYQPSYGLNNTGTFNKLLSHYYWSDTEYSFFPLKAWIFDFDDGAQTHGIKDYNAGFAWAVRDGDVSAPVPEPATMLLVSTGLACLVACRRKSVRRHG
ncbi:conserved hypothetical protein [uncultured Desulfobacterium sp.]|uniref:Ice-binding protein C-terminal domain-containing protein n=1 Tax=uncultured Desulfobacterium sp. TaxID=201089 RepID=A0A445N023_9BACT|nr:conserved hypothetical protein [uncultured Desulfobacterium sp.]